MSRRLSYRATNLASCSRPQAGWDIALVEGVASGASARHGPACPGHLLRHVLVAMARTRRMGANPNFLLWHYFKCLIYRDILANSAQNCVHYWLQSAAEITAVVPC